MQLSDFNFDLPHNLIARFGLPSRSSSRLMVLDRASKALSHQIVRDLTTLLRSGDLLVFNNTKVIPARLFGKKSTGGSVRFLIERIFSKTHARALVRSSKPLKLGAHIDLVVTDQNETLQPITVTITAKTQNFVEIFLNCDLTWFELLEKMGHMPLPPYLDRPDTPEDKNRYQTVYAKIPGAVAAPTAGLHFDDELLLSLKNMGVEFAEVTLHVGAGTFQPIKTKNPQDHPIHSEWMSLSKEASDQINAAKKAKRRVIAVGTTAVRSLETAANETGQVSPYEGETAIFIFPPYVFKCVDAMITNFHLPQSTLLMLVSAFAGRETVLSAYHQAILKQYRFYSYGDAMLIV